MSIEDFDLTNRLYYACLPFGMEILDHIILADSTYYSLLENRYMAIIHASLTYKSYKEVKPRIDKEKEDYGKEQLIEGKLEGLDKGMKLGEKVGEKAGIEIGKLEEKIAMAKKMLSDNMDIDIISKYTGFSKKEINKLK